MNPVVTPHSDTSFTFASVQFEAIVVSFIFSNFCRLSVKTPLLLDIPCVLGFALRADDVTFVGDRFVLLGWGESSVFRLNLVLFKYCKGLEPKLVQHSPQTFAHTRCYLTGTLCR